MEQIEEMLQSAVVDNSELSQEEKISILTGLKLKFMMWKSLSGFFGFLLVSEMLAKMQSN